MINIICFKNPAQACYQIPYEILRIHNPVFFYILWNTASIQLGSLYNLSHIDQGDGPLGYIFGIGNKPRLPHENPEPSVFGNRVKENY